MATPTCSDTRSTALLWRKEIVSVLWWRWTHVVLCPYPRLPGGGKKCLLTFPLIGQFKATAKLGEFLETKFSQSF